MNSIDNYLILGKMYIRNRLEWYLERWVLRIFVIRYLMENFTPNKVNECAKI